MMESFGSNGGDYLSPENNNNFNNYNSYNNNGNSGNNNNNNNNKLQGQEVSEQKFLQIIRKDQSRIEEFINYPLQNLLSSRSLSSQPSVGKRLSRIFLLTLITNKSVRKVLRQERKNFIYCLYEDQRQHADDQQTQASDKGIKIEQLLGKFVQYANLAFRQFAQNQSKEN